MAEKDTSRDGSSTFLDPTALKSKSQLRHEASIRQKEEEEDAKNVMQDAIASFDRPAGMIPFSMTFVSGGTFNLANNSEVKFESSSTAGKTLEYKIPAFQKKAPEVAETNVEPKGESSGQRQIDELMEEFKRNQEKRAKQKDRSRRVEASELDPMSATNSTLTSNLRLGNITTYVTPDLLTAEFSCYGPVLSTKVMMPRADDRDSRGRGSSGTCGFVLFANRADAERAKTERDGSVFHGSTLSIAWAPAPDPQSLAKMRREFFGSLSVSSHSSAQHYAERSSGKSSKHHGKVNIPKGAEVIYVVAPSHAGRFEIDSFAELVAKERGGDRLQQMALEQERDNPTFAFLFDKSGGSDYMYYKWRVASLKRGESLINWSTEPFQLDPPNGPYFVPPPPHNFASAQSNNNSASFSPMDLIPRHLAEQGEPLSDEDRARFESLLRALTASRESIRGSMTWALDHSEHAPEITQVLTEALVLPDTPSAVKLARFFLVSDILHNAHKMGMVAPDECPKMFLYTSSFYNTLPMVLKSFGIKYKAIPGRISAQAFKDHIFRVLASWRKQSVFMPPFLDSLVNSFNLVQTAPTQEAPPMAKPSARENSSSAPSSSAPEGENELNGTPVSTYNSLPIDFDSVMAEEIARLRKRAREGDLDELLPEGLVKKLKS